MDVDKETVRVYFENFLCILFIVLACLNIRGNYDDLAFLKIGDFRYKDESNDIFTFTISITLVIYIYFFIRNYSIYVSIPDEEKDLYLIKLFGSVFLIMGALFLLYFQMCKY